MIDLGIVLPSCFLAEFDKMSACFGTVGDASAGGEGVESQPINPVTMTAMATSPTEANLLTTVIKRMPLSLMAQVRMTSGNLKPSGLLIDKEMPDDQYPQAARNDLVRLSLARQITKQVQPAPRGGCRWTNTSERIN